MIAVFEITLPIYAAIAIGYLSVWKGWFDGQDMRSLGSFVFKLALPALIFTSVATQDPRTVFQPGYVLAYGLGGLATITASFIWFRAVGSEPERSALGVMGCTCPNSGFIGYPIMLLAFPDVAGTVLALNVLVEQILLIPICLLLLEATEGSNGQGLGRRLCGILWNLLKIPTVIAMLAGLAVSMLGIPLAEPVVRIPDMFLAAAGAVSLVVIGGSLVGLPMQGNWNLAAQVTVGKLILHPAMTALVALLIVATGLAPLKPELFAAVILSSAIPMFTSYTVFAQQRGLQGAASLASLAGTMGAFVTLNLLLWILV